MAIGVKLDDLLHLSFGPTPHDLENCHGFD